MEFPGHQFRRRRVPDDYVPLETFKYKKFERTSKEKIHDNRRKGLGRVGWVKDDQGRVGVEGHHVFLGIMPG